MCQFQTGKSAKRMTSGKHHHQHQRHPIMTHRCRYHGPAACHVSAANWNICKTDDEWEGALKSWYDTTLLPEETEPLWKWLDALFRYGRGPIIWLDRAERSRAHIYLVSHHGSGIKRHCYYQQRGCRYCGGCTNQLYHADPWDIAGCKRAFNGVLQFLKPMLMLLDSYKQVHLPLQAVHDATTICPRPTTSSRSSDSAQAHQPPSVTAAGRVWTKYKDASGAFW